MNVGDQATYKGTSVKIVKFGDVPTPGGRSVRVALIERPRAGRKWVFTTELHRATEEPVLAEGRSEAFR